MSRWLRRYFRDVDLSFLFVLVSFTGLQRGRLLNWDWSCGGSRPTDAGACQKVAAQQLHPD